MLLGFWAGSLRTPQTVSSMFHDYPSPHRTLQTKGKLVLVALSSLSYLLPPFETLPDTMLGSLFPPLPPDLFLPSAPMLVQHKLLTRRASVLEIQQMFECCRKLLSQLPQPVFPCSSTDTSLAIPYPNYNSNPISSILNTSLSQINFAPPMGSKHLVNEVPPFYGLLVRGLIESAKYSTNF